MWLVALLLALLLVFVIGGVAAYVLDERQRQSERARRLRERLRVEHEQFLAEMRLHRLTQTALQHLLDEARSPDGSIPEGWQRT